MVPLSLRCVLKAWALQKPETINVGGGGATESSSRRILQRSGLERLRLRGTWGPPQIDRDHHQACICMYAAVFRMQLQVRSGEGDNVSSYGSVYYVLV